MQLHAAILGCRHAVRLFARRRRRERRAITSCAFKCSSTWRASAATTPCVSVHASAAQKRRAITGCACKRGSTRRASIAAPPCTSPHASAAEEATRHRELRFQKAASSGEPQCPQRHELRISDAAPCGEPHSLGSRHTMRLCTGERRQHRPKQRAVELRFGTQLHTASLGSRLKSLSAH